MISRGHSPAFSTGARRGLTLTWLILFVFSILLQYGALVSPTLAVHDDNLFEMDGNAVDNGAVVGDDWENVYNGTSNAFSTQFIPDPFDSLTDPTFTGGATKDDLPLSGWKWSTGAPPAKNDIVHAFAAAYSNPADGHTIAYFGLDKWEADGDNYAGFWFYKNQIGRTGDGSGSGSPFTGDHAVGDILVLADYTNGGSIAAFSVYKWVGSGGNVNGTLQTVATGVPCTGAPATDLACGATNGANTPSPWAFTGRDAKAGEENTFLPATFFEGGIDLTALGLDTGCFTSFLAETRSSQSVDAVLKDFAGGSFSFCKTPDMTTTASSGSMVIGGAGISDDAHVTVDGQAVTTGDVDFFLCGPTGSAADCTTGGVDAGQNKPLNGTGHATSNTMAPTQPGWYCFRAEYDPAAGSKILENSHTNHGTECFQVLKASPAIATSADQSVSAGQAISDSATLSGGYSPTGSIVFKAYGPNDATCTGTAAFTSSPVTVNGNGTYGPVSFTPSVAGVYRWIASYSGDANNNAVSGACNDTGETDTVNKVNPSISTSASQSVTIGGSISDSASLSGGVSPTGTITFTAYGPNDATCTGQAAYSTTVSVNGNGSYGPVSFVPSAVGTYRWIAAYGGDANNNAVTGLCNDAGENDTVNPASPAISTTASAGVVLGGSISDTAHLSGGVSPTGTITFRLYGPDNASCSGTPIFTSTVNVNGNGDYASGAFTPTAAGTYRWVAAYSGDAKNNSVSGACNDANESVVVAKKSPTIATTLVSGEAQGQNLTLPIGSTVHDTATLSGASANAGGTVTYTVYSDSSCQTAFAAAGTKAVTNGSIGASDDVTFTAAATYYWQAVYSGDANNNGATSPCTSEVVTIVPNTVTINTSLSGQGHTGTTIQIQIGNSVTDSATLTGKTANAGGTVSYVVYSDNACASAFAAAGTKTVTNGVVPNSDPVTFNAAGTYYWQAVYSGDANNESAISPCTAEVVTVVVPAIDIVKTVDDADHIVAHGQSLTYSLALTVVNGPVTQSVVSDPLPVGQTFVSASNGGTYDAGTRTITWNLGTLQSGAPVLTLTYVVTVDANAATGAQVNTATFDTNETPPDSSTETVTVPALVIDKALAGNTGGTAVNGMPIAKVGDTLTYTLTYDLTNGPVHNGVITDTLPAGLTYVAGSATNSGNGQFVFQSYDAGTRKLTWAAAVVSADSSVTYKVTVDSNAFTLAQPLENVATIDSDETDLDDAQADVLVQTVETATATPNVTLPPSDALDQTGSSGSDFGLTLILFILTGIALFASPTASRIGRLRRQEVTTQRRRD